MCSRTPSSPSAEHLLRRVGDREELARRLVDADIGRLRREHDGDEQRVGVDVLELALGFRIGGLEAPEDLDEGRPVDRLRAGAARGGFAAATAAARVGAPSASLVRAAGSASGRASLRYIRRWTAARLPLTGPSTAEPLRRPVFAAVIRPHRSLDAARLPHPDDSVVRLRASAASVPFLVLGFWPVAGFFGARPPRALRRLPGQLPAARSFEEVVLTPHPAPRPRNEPPRRAAGVALQSALDADRPGGRRGVRPAAPLSRLRAREVVIARDLSPAERESFAEALGERSPR